MPLTAPVTPVAPGARTTTVNVPLNVVTHPITAAYPGSADFAGSTDTDTHTVTP